MQKQKDARSNTHSPCISVDSINQSIRLGAVSFLPKEELERLPELIAEILADLAEGKTHWQRLFQRLGPFFKERLGLTWDDLEQRHDRPIAID